MRSMIIQFGFCRLTESDGRQNRAAGAIDRAVLLDVWAGREIAATVEAALADTPAMRFQSTPGRLMRESRPCYCWSAIRDA